MTDVAYLCHNCGSVHEVESIRDNLILDLRTAASYELSGHRGILGLRTRFRRWRMIRGAWPRPSGPRIRTVHAWPGDVGSRPAGPRPDLIALDLAEQQQLPALAWSDPVGAGLGRPQRGR